MDPRNLILINVLFGFRDILQYVTVPPNLSETRYCISENEALYGVKAILISVNEPSKREKRTQFCVF